MLVTGAVLGPPPGNEQSENDNRHGSRAQFRRLDQMQRVPIHAWLLTGWDVEIL